MAFLPPFAALQLTVSPRRYLPEAYTLVTTLISVFAAQVTLPESLALVASRAYTWGLTGLHIFAYFKSAA